MTATVPGASRVGGPKSDEEPLGLLEGQASVLRSAVPVQSRQAGATGGVSGHTYLFYRKGSTYSVQLDNDTDARTQAAITPGTQRVEAVDGRVVWQAQASIPPERRF